MVADMGEGHGIVRVTYYEDVFEFHEPGSTYRVVVASG